MVTRAERPVQAVIFDYGGVLRRDERASAYDALDIKFGLAPGALWWALHDIPEYRLSREGTIDRAAYRAAARLALLEREGTDGRVDAALAAFDAHIAALAPLDADMQRLLDRLRTAGRVRLGLLSNAPRGFTERLRSAGVTAFFDDVFVSGDIGFAKPDPAVYRIAADRLGVEPAVCLMIDDQMRNIEGARTAGLRTHLFEHVRLPDLLARLTAEGALGLERPPGEWAGDGTVHPTGGDMATVKLIEYAEASPEVRAVYDDIMATRKVDRVNNFWKALASHPPTLRRTWETLKSVMAPGALDPLTKEMIYLAVSATNGCRYCIASHTASARGRGMTEAMLGELMAVVGMANETNSLADGYQIEVDEMFRSPA